MSNILVFFLHGLAYAGLLFLVSSGLTLVLGMMNVLNFAHAALYILGPIFLIPFSMQPVSSGFPSFGCEHRGFFERYGPIFRTCLPDLSYLHIYLWSPCQSNHGIGFI